MKSKHFLPFLIITLLFSFTFIMPVPVAHAQSVIRVTTTGATAWPCGDTWANACSLQIALLRADLNGEIWVAAGTYKPTTTNDRNATFRLYQGYAVYGGFAGTETARDQRNWTTHVVTLSGDLNGDDVGFTNNGENSYHVLFTNSTTPVTLDGVTISGGNANGSGNRSYGGGILDESDSLVLVNVIVSGNSAAINGGGMHSADGSPTLTAVTFSGNRAASGGGLYNGIRNEPTLTRVTFGGNSATSQGGGMYNDPTSNSTLTAVTFHDNTAASGGGIYNVANNLALTNGTFYGNSATAEGGAMNIRSSNPTLTNVTFSANSASSGGGIYAWEFSNPQVRNSIFWGNAGGQIYKSADSTVTVSDSVVQGGYAGGSNILVADPLLGALGDYGGGSQTLPLLPGSSAIDAGNDTHCPATDQRGVPRPQGPQCDIGAFELVYLIPTATTTAATAVTFNSATLNGIVNANGSSTTVTFEYGLTTSYGTTVTASPSPVTGSTDTAVSYALGGLLPNTTYHYRVAATNAGGATNGGDQSFTTACDITVTNANDSGPGSLRQAIADVCAGSTITFADDYTITLASQIHFEKGLTLSGAGRNVTINGGGATRLFSITGDGFQVFFDHLTLTGGRAASGGAIYLNYRYGYNTLTMSNVTVHGNHATQFGGAIWVNYSTLRLYNNTFYNNTTGWVGGGIYSNYGPLVIENSTFTNNRAPNNENGFAGAISTRGTSLILRNNTFFANQASSGAHLSLSSVALTATNNIFANGLTSRDLHCACSDFAGCAIGGVSNIATSNQCGGTVIASSQALFAPLGDYGGDAPTLPLLPGNPAINGGDSCLDTDQRGVTRSAPTCDAGAFESQGFVLALSGGNNQTAFINTPFAAPLGLTVSANDALEPVAGGRVTFTPPGSGASATLSDSPATIGAGGAVSVSATANGIVGGPYNVTANAAGVATAVNFSLTNTRGNTAVTLTSSPNPSTYGQSVTFTANVSPAAATGTVAFQNSGAAISGCALQPVSGGQATCTTAVLPAGEYAQMTAVYSGDANYNSSTSTNYTHTVNKATATIALGDLNQTYDGTPKAASAATTPAGLTVIITYTGSGGTVYGPSTTAPTNAGTYEVDAAVDDANYQGTASDTLTINKADTTTALTASPNPSVYGQSVVFTAAVSPAAATGTVTFQSNGVALPGCEAQPISDGQATCTTDLLPVGVHGITAVYSGDTLYNSSTGALAPDQQVNCRTPIFVTSDANAGPGSLADAIANVCPGGAINFNGDYAITLASGLTLDKDMTIDGETHAITISGNDAVRVFKVDSGAEVTLAHLTISDGRDTSSECDTHSCGGGLKVEAGAAVTLTHSVLLNNRAYYGGGIFSSGALRILHSTIANNVAQSWDGGIYSSGSLTIENSTISGNTATSGNVGGLASVGSLTMTNSTIFGNTAAGDTGGLRQQGGTASLYNTIIAYNSGLDCSLTDGGALLANVHNLVEDGTCSPYLSGDPRLGPLADNGGGTLTHALLPNSPAIDAGDAAACATTDQRDLARDDLGCDLGAYEVRYADSDTVARPVAATTLTTFGPAMVGLQRDEAFADPGVITVTKGIGWATQGPESIGAWWEITPTVTEGFSLTLQLCYTATELGTLNENDLRFWRWHDGGWAQVGSELMLTTVNGHRCALMSGVDGLSVWTLATAKPTAVTLAMFSAASQVGWLAGLLVGLLVVAGTAVLWRRRK